MRLNNIKKNVDISFGLAKEKSILPIIKTRFGDDITKHPDKYSLYDFSNNNTLIELKSRNIRHNQYPTALIGANKIDFFYKQIKENNKKVILLYSYTDGIFYVEYTGNEDWKNDRICRYGRGVAEPSVVYHIPYTSLTKIE